MKFSKRGWFKRYLKFRDANSDFMNLRHSFMQFEFDDKEQPIYATLQPTGLMYGFPIKFPNFTPPFMQELNQKDKLKAILTESLICSILINYKRENTFNDFELIDQNISRIADFYTHFINDENLKKKLKRVKSPYRLVEIYIDKQIDVKSSFSNFWNSFFQNSLLFLDVIYFFKWLDNEDKLKKDELINQKEKTLFTIIKIIAATAGIDKDIHKEERLFFEYFVNSAHLSPEKKQIALNYLEKPEKLEDIDFQTIDSWVLKKYLLELAILTIWADKDVNDTEIAFLNQLRDRLEMPDAELKKSMILIEAFVLNNWQDVFYLNNKRDYQTVSNRLVRRITLFIGINKRKIINEIQESKELVALLIKSRNQKLNDEEKQKVKEQLMDILKTIPSLAIFLLPFGSLILPILLKIIPQHLILPSSFHDD